MQNIAFFLIILGLCLGQAFADNSKPMTVDELFFGDYNKAVEMTPSESMEYSKKHNTIVIFFSDKMSPAAVEDTNDFLENRGYDVTLAKGLRIPPEDNREEILGVWVGGLMAGVYELNQVADGSAYVRIIRTIEKTTIKPDPNKVVDLYK